MQNFPYNVTLLQIVMINDTQDKNRTGHGDTNTQSKLAHLQCESYKKFILVFQNGRQARFEIDFGKTNTKDVINGKMKLQALTPQNNSQQINL